MDSVLETQRKLHEERERVIETIVKETMTEQKTHKGKINAEKRIKDLVERYHRCTAQLEKFYKDEDQSRTKEVDAVGGPNEFAEFYARLKQLKDSHRRNPDELAEPLSLEFQRMQEEIVNPERIEGDTIDFTDEEGYGRFLDLHVIFQLFINLKGIKKVDYLAYLSILDKFVDIPRNTKKTGGYKEYLQALKEYLVSFMDRTRPLYELDDEFKKSDALVTRDMANGTLAGWNFEKPTPKNATSIDLSQYSKPTELEGLGLDRLKEALMALGLKCGGTLKERSARLYQAKGQNASDLGKTELARPKEADDKEAARNLTLAQLEGHIRSMCSILSEELVATRENVERKQARTAGEMEEDDEEQEIESDNEDDDSVPYNPKNLPLGWDGKPIPYWLYKLHGLNISYSCEICGNQVYKGPKAFQKHFNEWRHSHGMRCLGIPNTAHFANITKIKDALDLWSKIKNDKETLKWNAELDEEYEDTMGNVLSRKTFEDLQRQGLL